MTTDPAHRHHRNPRGEGHRLRAALVEAACELLEQSGTQESLSLRAVARRAGVAATSVYLHFADREELLWAVSETLFAELGETMDAAAAGAATPTDELHKRALAYCHYALNRPAHYHVLFSVIPAPKNQRELPDLPGGPVFAALESAVRRIHDRPPQADPRTITVLLWATLHGLASLRTTKPQFPWPPVDNLVEAALATLVPGRHAPGDTSSEQP